MKLPSLVVLLALMAQTAGQAEPRHFRYQRSIALPSTSAGGQTCAPVDATIFRHATVELSDLRLYSGGREVPYAIRGALAPAAGPDVQAEVLNIGERGGHLVFDAKIPRASYQTIQIETQARDFIATVRLSGSATADGAASTQLGTFTIFDLTGQQLNRSTVLHLPVSTFAYLHFEIAGPLKPADITGITVVESPVQALAYRTVAESRTIARNHEQSIVTFDLPAHVPVEHIEFVPKTSGRNFSRDVMVLTTPPHNREPSVSAGNIFRVHTVQNGVRLDQEQLAFDLSGAAPRVTEGNVRWTVIIQNGDDEPLALSAVRLSMRERQLCFDATVGAAYTLYYGDSVLAAPRYDYARLFQSSDHPSAAVFGPEQLNPQFVARPDTRPLTERYPVLLWTALVIIVVLLGLIAIRTAKQTPPPAVS